MYMFLLNLSIDNVRQVLKNPGQVNVRVYVVSFSVNSNAQRTPLRIYGEPYVHKFCAVDIFLISPVVKQYHPLPSSIKC